MLQGEAKKVAATYTKCGGERGGAGEKTQSWTGGAWSLVSTRAKNENREESVDPATGRETRTFPCSRANGTTTGPQGRSVGKLRRGLRGRVIRRAMSFAVLTMGMSGKGKKICMHNRPMAMCSVCPVCMFMFRM
jgi:hypothetical protein